MKKHLYFVCPTDCIESVIDNTFGQENYFCTSLGNSITFDQENIRYINNLIESKDITEITFILSDENQMIEDALSNQDFSHVICSKHFYTYIDFRKEYSEVLWKKNSLQVPILSYFLNMKIKELELKINSRNRDRVKINGKVYNSDKNFFLEINLNLFNGDLYDLN